MAMILPTPYAPSPRLPALRPLEMVENFARFIILPRYTFTSLKNFKLELNKSTCQLDKRNYHEIVKGNTLLFLSILC